MGLISTTIPNLVNGVSQQPSPLRLPSQGHAQINCLDSVVDGKKKRPATSHRALLASGNIGSAYCHTINRDISERYEVIITDGDLKVFKLDGTEKTVAFPDGKTYLDVDVAAEDFAAMTVADYTFIVNKTRIVAMLDAEVSASPDRGGEALVFIKQATHDTDYTLNVNDSSVYFQHTFVTGSTGKVSTTNIANQLMTSMAGSLGSGWTLTLKQSCIHIRRNDGANFNCWIEDSRGNTHTTVAVKTVQQFSKLPTCAPRDFVCEVVGDNTSDFDNYFVKFQPNNDDEDFDEGVWIETVKPGIAWELDPTTMPMALIRESDGTFSLEEMDWGNREAGDETSAADPSFVGRTLNDIFFFEKRLGFLSDENAIMSRPAYFFDFFPEGVTLLSDANPIDSPASNTKVSILHHAIPWSKGVLFFSDQTQFELESDGILSPKNAPIKPLTNFESNIHAKPAAAGKNVFFAIDRGDYNGIMEYYIEPESETKDAAEITAHVAKYVPAGVFKLAASSNLNTLLALTTGEPNTMYVYRYYWSGTEKLQSSWSKWTLNGATILNGDFIESELYLVVQRGDGVYLEVMNLAPGYADDGESIEFHLDRKITATDCTVTYDSDTDLTTFILPYTIAADDDFSVVTRGTGGGSALTVASQTATAIRVRGDYSTTGVFIGENYSARYTFSHQSLKEQTANGGKAIVTEGRLQLRTMSLLYEDSGYFRVEVTPLHRDTGSFPMLGLLGAVTLGQTTIGDGTFRFPVWSKANQVAIEVVDDTFLPFRLVSAGWEGYYHTRSKRL